MLKLKTMSYAEKQESEYKKEKEPKCKEDEDFEFGKEESSNNVGTVLVCQPRAQLTVWPLFRRFVDSILKLFTTR